MHLGIDYGAKLSGNTAICFDDDVSLHIIRVAKNKDADKFLKSFITERQPSQIFIDAPLSLPLAYTGRGTDFFYRQCDRDCKAMSPMFLGGLTARAMALRYHFNDIPFFESYPKQVVILLDLKLHYKQNIDLFKEQLILHLPITLMEQPLSWHEVDAILAWLVGHRYNQGIHQQYGRADEGVIIV